MKRPPPLTVKDLPFFPIMSQNSNSIWVIHFRRLFIWDFFLNDEIIRPVKKLRWYGHYSRKGTNSAKNTVNERPAPVHRPIHALIRGSRGLSHLGTARCPATRPPSNQPEDKQAGCSPSQLSPKRALLSPLLQMQVAKPPPGKLSPISHFKKGIENQATRSEEPRRWIFLHQKLTQHINSLCLSREPSQSYSPLHLWGPLTPQRSFFPYLF